MSVTRLLTRSSSSEPPPSHRLPPFHLLSAGWLLQPPGRHGAAGVPPGSRRFPTWEISAATGACGGGSSGLAGGRGSGRVLPGCATAPAAGASGRRRRGCPYFYLPLGVTSPACLPVQHGHRDSPLAWRPSERKFPPRSPAFRTFGGGALSAFQKVAPDAVPFGPGLPQGHGGWNQGAGARSNHPLGAVAGVRPLWAGGSGQGSPWDSTLGAMPACPGPPVRPETAPAA